MGCEIWQGYHQSVRQGWKRVLLNINITSSVFLREIPVLEYLHNITEHDVKINRGVLSEINRKKFAKEIKSMLQRVYCECNLFVVQQIKTIVVEEIEVLGHFRVTWFFKLISMECVTWKLLQETSISFITSS